MKLIQADCLEYMKSMSDNSIDFIATDPPYGIHFMGKQWDYFKKSNFDESQSGNIVHRRDENKADKLRRVRKICSGNSIAGSYDNNCNDGFQEFMRQVGVEMIRILKPGAHIAMFGAPRRHQRQMVGLEDAGFEIRDCIAWIFGQGFPKSYNKFGLEGYGTALKPAYEPIILAMKPLEGTFKENAEKWGVAGINIKDCRIGIEKRINNPSANQDREKWRMNNGGQPQECAGRWPANIIFDEEAAHQLDLFAGILKSGKGVSRFFYCAKASPSERNKGLEGFPLKECDDWPQDLDPNSKRKAKPRQNNHPTVKPISLMKYIITLLAPPGNPICLDPFMGSGTTGIACSELGVDFIGIEKEKEYFDIAESRIKNSQSKWES